jgi:hypothetical protein
MANVDRRRGQSVIEAERAEDKTATGGASPAGSHASGRSQRGLLFVGGWLVLLLVAATVAWKRLPHEDGGRTDAPLGRPATTVAVPSADAIRAEFQAVADQLLTRPGGLMDVTSSERLRRFLAQPGGDFGQVLSAQCDLVQALQKEAKEEESVAEAEKLFEMLASRPTVLALEPKYHRIRAQAYLRLAEVQNCIRSHNRECCVFPLQGGGVHERKEPAREAAASYAAYLKARPDDLAVRWLLNIVLMADGSWPESVPPEHLIPATGPGASSDFPRFRDVAQACGITRQNRAGGCVVDDMDGDGLLDIVLSSCAPDASLVLYQNRGDGRFEDKTETAGIANQWGGLDLVSTDYDNDGDVDLFVMRGAWMYDEGRIRRSLLQNDGTGKFTDVTHAAGLAGAPAPTQACAWFDYDSDGDLDVFVGNESRADASVFPPEANGAGHYPSSLYRNEGDGSFTDVAQRAGVLNDRYCKGVTAGDYDDDGWTDLYVSNIGKNRLYRNRGDGTFEDVAETLDVVEPAGRSFAPWFFDYDNDGHLDLFVGAYDVPLEDAAAWHLGLPFQSAPPRLYRNRGDGTFEDTTRAMGLWRPMQPMGANFGDLDNDGWLDFYLSTGNPEYEALIPNVMFRNDGGRAFLDVTVAGGFGNLQKGHGVAFADLDHDGDQDVFNELGGFFQGDTFFNSLYENPGNANRFLTLKLVGRRTNRMAYGARIRVVVATPDGPREMHRAVGSVSSFGGSPARQEIGLGDATAIESVEIWWPASGTRQTLKDLALDSFYEVTEGGAAKKLEPRRFALAGG